jgi:cytochrome c peroxidase
MRRHIIAGWIGSLAVALLAAGGATGQKDQQAVAQLAERAKATFGILPKQAPNPANPVTRAKVGLGRMLYFDKRLSKNHDISCNSCHPLDRFGADGEATSPGHRGQRGNRNSPTVYNAALHIAQFWDGRAADVEEQAKGPVLNPVEMAMPDAAAVEAVLRSMGSYMLFFGPAFPDDSDPLSFDNMALAIAAFERRLLTPAPFDDFQAGNLSALEPRQQQGLSVFMETGCPSCHAGPLVGGSMFQKLGAVHPYETEDAGRFAVTGEEADRYVFKVPSLRNVEKTGPYFHDGSVKTLPEAVRLMAHHQLGLELGDDRVGDIVAFLESLTGQVSPRLSAPPEMPPTGPNTPAPDPS